MYSIIDLLLTIVIVISILFSFQLLFISSNAGKKANMALGSYFLILSVYYLLNTPYVLNIQQFQNVFFVSVLPFFVAINPFYYFYVKHLTDNQRIYKPIYWLHFAPVFLFTLSNVITYFYMPVTADFIEFKKTFRLHDFIYHWLSIKSRSLAIIIYCIQIVIYSTLIIVEILKHQSRIKNHFSDISRISLKWIFILISATVFFTLIDVMLYFKVIEHDEVFTELYFVFLIFYLCFVGFFGLSQPTIYGANLLNEKMDKEVKVDFIIENNSNVIPPIAADLKYANSKLTDNEKDLIFNVLIECMIAQKPYLNPKLTIHDLALLMNVNKNYLSQVINEKLGVNFFLFINQYRVNEAKKMLSNKDFNHLSIEGIANSVGFNSRSVFNVAFKQITAVTPSQFKEEINRKDMEL